MVSSNVPTTFGVPKLAFRIHLEDYFYALELYDGRGESIYTLEEAIIAAEEQYGNRGWEVYNGNEGINRFSEAFPQPEASQHKGSHTPC